MNLPECIVRSGFFILTQKQEREDAYGKEAFYADG